jgi:hypothetical protein
MLAKPQAVHVSDMANHLRKTPPCNVRLHEPIRDIHLQDLIRDLRAMLRDCDHLSIIAVKHYV